MKHIQSTFNFLSIFIAIAALTACSPAQFSMYSDANKAAGVPEDSSNDETSDQPPKVCDPFDPSNVISSTAGLKGSIHYFDKAPGVYTTSTDFINNGKKIDADLFLNQLLVPTRIFDTGFATAGGTPLKKPDGSVLTEWFALNLHSKLKLGSADTEGTYQLAILSDDGSTLNLQNKNGVFEPIVENEGEHSTKLGCAAKTVTLSRSSKIPLNLTYYQGPRRHIALTLMWRKVTVTSGGNELKDSECGKSGNEYFFEPGTETAVATPKSPYLGLLARGWKPLNAENFELQSGSNRCAP